MAFVLENTGIYTLFQTALQVILKKKIKYFYFAIDDHGQAKKFAFII